MERRGFRKRVINSKPRQEERKTTLISIRNIGKVENPLDFHPTTDIAFDRDIRLQGSARMEHRRAAIEMAEQ